MILSFVAIHCVFHGHSRAGSGEVKQGFCAITDLGVPIVLCIKPNAKALAGGRENHKKMFMVMNAEKVIFQKRIHV